jgi:hypothetical protein
MRLEPVTDSTKIRIHTGNPNVGTLRLWVPEAVSSNTGFSAVYPVGAWNANGDDCEQTVSGEGLIGPGSYKRLDERTLESLGRRIPADNPVEWTTRVSVEQNVVNFSIALCNLGESSIHKAGAAICLKFLEAPWWSTDSTFVLSQGKLTPLSELDTDGQEPREYQAYLLQGQSYDNMIYFNGWRFCRGRVDKPFLISQNTEAKVCVVIDAENAYFVHRNMGNEGPCTDIMLAFGDIEPGKAANASGCVTIKEGLADNAVEAIYSVGNHDMEK